MKKLVRIISVLLCIAMAVGLFAGVISAVSAEETTQTWTKVTTAPADWSGQYLIVYEDGSLIFDGSLQKLDAVSDTQAVTITDGTISANTAYSFTIAPVEGGYSIKSASGRYIGRTSDSNGINESTSTAYVNTISLEKDGTVSIISGEAHLRYNKTSGQTRFRYFKSSTYTSQQAICLYKLTETTGGGDVTPPVDPPVEETPTPVDVNGTFYIADASGTSVMSTKKLDGNYYHNSVSIASAGNDELWTITTADGVTTITPYDSEDKLGVGDSYTSMLSDGSATFTNWIAYKVGDNYQLVIERNGEKLYIQPSTSKNAWSAHTTETSVQLIPAEYKEPEQPEQPAEPVYPTNVIISEVYGGGGNNGAPFTHDFIELYNPTDKDIDLTNWTVQWAAKTGKFNLEQNNYVKLSGTIKSHGFYLIQCSKGTTGSGKTLPLPNATGNITIGATEFKIALTNSVTVVNALSDSHVVDFLGAGDCDQYEGTAAGKGANDKSVYRKDLTLDHNDNSKDFEAGTPTPKSGHVVTHTSVRLGQNLDLYFYIPESSWNETHYAIFSHGDIPTDKVTQWYSAKIDGVEHYAVAYTGIAAQDMGDEITVTIYTGDGQVVCTAKESIKSYAQRGAQNEGYKSFMEALANYGAAAELYFNEKLTSSTINDFVENNTVTFNVVKTEEHDIVSTTQNCYGTNLDLESTIGLYFHFTGIDDLTGLTAKVSYTTHNGTTKSYDAKMTFVTLNDTTVLRVVVDTLALADYKQAVTVQIVNAEGNTVADATDSMYNHLVRGYTSGSAKSTDRMKALYACANNVMEEAYKLFHPTATN